MTIRLPFALLALSAVLAACGGPLLPALCSRWSRPTGPAKIGPLTATWKN